MRRFNIAPLRWAMTKLNAAHFSVADISVPQRSKRHQACLQLDYFNQGSGEEVRLCALHSRYSSCLMTRGGTQEGRGEIRPFNGSVFDGLLLLIGEANISGIRVALLTEFLPRKNLRCKQRRLK